MNMIRSKKLWAGTLATGAAAALSLTLVTSSAPADNSKLGLEPAKIKMVFDPQGGPPAFVGDASVASGQDLKIVNNSKPKQIGPHTFSLVEEGSLPTTNKQMKKCGKIELPVCVNIFKTHDVSKKFIVKTPDVDKGETGWDTSFDDNDKGDTWYTETKNESGDSCGHRCARLDALLPLHRPSGDAGSDRRHLEVVDGSR